MRPQTLTRIATRTADIKQQQSTVHEDLHGHIKETRKMMKLKKWRLDPREVQEAPKELRLAPPAAETNSRVVTRSSSILAKEF